MSLLIRNVNILAGAKDYPENSDVLISGNLISAIDRFPKKKADEIINGKGSFLAPGFIDIDTTSDHKLTLFSDPHQENFLREGITTIIGGHCGSSLAPSIYGALDSIRKWGSAKSANVDWHTIEEFLKSISKRGMGVNYGTLAGHSTIRRDLIGDELRALSKNELNVFGNILDQAMREGAFGVSTGLNYLHAKDASDDELKKMLQIVKKYGGMYSVHLKNLEKGIYESLRETIKLAREEEVNTLINHFLPTNGNENEYMLAIEMINSLPKDVPIHFSLPLSDSVSLPIYQVLPNRIKSSGPFEVMCEYLSDSNERNKIISELPDLKPSEIFIEEAQNNEELIGRSLESIMEAYEIRDSREMLFEIMKSSKLRAVISKRIVSNKLLKEAIKSPRALLGSHIAGLDRKAKILSYGPKKISHPNPSFKQIITLPRGSKDISYQKAIEMITKKPAKKLNLSKRGTVGEGFIADLVLFKNGRVITTIVNGIVSFQDGKLLNGNAGKPVFFSLDKM